MIRAVLNIQDACGEATPPPLCSAVLLMEVEDVQLYLDLLSVFFIGSIQLYLVHAVFNRQGFSIGKFLVYPS